MFKKFYYKLLWRVKMSEEVGLLEKLKAQHQSYIAQREQAQINIQQLMGAVYALEMAIKSHEESMKDSSEGGNTDEQTNEQAEE